MIRPRHTWYAFATALLLALASLAWLSRAALNLDAAQHLGRAEAEREERIRLALWRMDSALTLLLADEDARSPLDFHAFHRPIRAWDTTQRELPPESLLLPSPLLTLVSSNSLLHFELRPGLTPSSPHLPPPSLRDLARSVGLDQPRQQRASDRLVLLQSLLGQAAPGLDPFPFLHSRAAAATTNPAAPDILTTPIPLLADTGSDPEQSLLNRNETQARQVFVLNNPVQQRNAYGNAFAQQLQADNNLPPASFLAVGPFTPVWITNQLFLLRQVSLESGPRLQGVWLDVAVLQRSLLDGVADLLPAASLLPRLAPPPSNDPHQLVALPLTLNPGPVPSRPQPAWSPIRLALAAAWSCLAIASLAIGLLLHGTLDLSERRADFVSAVTHELRTPLTTFRLYSEMLAEDMVPDPDRRRSYLQTLSSESTRLGHLVENILAFARLERRNDAHQAESIRLQDLLARLQPRLLAHARAAGFTLHVQPDPTHAALPVHVDLRAVDHILFNLLDNATKYGRPSPPHQPALFIESLPPNRSSIRIRIRDLGPGISPDLRPRLFEPFHRSAEQAAGQSPGVGLGLALARRLSRSLGGNLTLDTTVSPGAAFILTLPRARSRS